MASLYKQPKSRFWWLKYRDGGRIFRVSTGLRIDDKRETALAKVKRAEADLREARSTRAPAGDVWRLWVPQWLIGQYKTSPKTLQKYRLYWAHVEAFLDANKVERPSQFKREMVERYIEWRTAQVRPKSRKHCSHNTAVNEIRWLGMVLNEAAARGFVVANVMAGMKIRKEAVAIKPEITDEEIVRVEAVLVDRPEWMRRAWFIALRTGLRLRETSFPLDGVDFKNGTILIPKPKGGVEKAFRVPVIYPELLVEVRRWCDGGDRVSLEVPEFGSLEWRDFFNGLGLHHISFHCLRVTFISRQAQAGTPENVTMRLVNHSSKLVSRIYQRFATADLVKLATAVPLPSGLTPVDGPAPTRARAKRPLRRAV